MSEVLIEIHNRVFSFISLVERVIVMSLKVIKCKDSYIDSFCDILKADGYSLSSLKARLNNGFKGNVLVVSSHVNLGP